MSDDRQVWAVISRYDQLRRVKFLIMGKDHFNRRSGYVMSWEGIRMDILRICWINADEICVNEVLDFML